MVELKRIFRERVSLVDDSKTDAVGSSQFQTAVAGIRTADRTTLWSGLRERKLGQAAPDSSILETGVSPISSLDEAPPRTIHSIAIMRASPMSSSVRAMIEKREFGRSARQFDLGDVRARLPGLDCPAGDVAFLASAASFGDLSLSVDALLQHRKALLASSLNPAAPRRNVFVLGAGPGGLMAAIQLRLRNHRVVVCEQRDVYTRNRFIGVYKPVAHLMASLGMPECMTYDFTHYRGKRGLMCADIQTFLHGVALKLGVIIYTGTVVREMTLSALRSGQLELQRSTRGTGDTDAYAIGMTRWHHDTVTTVRSGVVIRFDTIVEATGGRSGFRELAVGSDNVVSLRTIGRAAAHRDPTLDSYFDDPEDHCAQFVESDYGCPPDIRRKFSQALLDETGVAIPDELPGLVSNVDASIIVQPIEASIRVPGAGARIGDQELDIPRDWVLVRCPLPDKTLTRYQIEGPLPQTFEFDGKRLPTSECLAAVNPVTLLVRLLYAMGIPFDAVDRKRLVEFYTKENSRGDASDIVAAFTGTFRGLRVGGEQPIWCGRVPGSEVEYGIIGEALQNAWYRFGVGVDDTFAGAAQYAEDIELAPESRNANALRFERVMTARSVQVLYHLYLVNQNTDQGVVGPVLTECYIDRRYRGDLADARLREETRRASEMLATLADLRSPGASPLLEAAIERRRDLCCRAVLDLIRSFDYDSKLLDRATQTMRIETPDWRARVFAALESVLGDAHREVLELLAQQPPTEQSTRTGAREARLVELAMGRYDWASPWVRACALHALAPAESGAIGVLTRATSDRIPLVAETANAVLRASERTSYTTIEKVLLLEAVSIFRAIPHDELADIAGLVTERWARAGEPIVEQGDVADCLYVIASGRVRVHAADHTFTELGRSEFFGELSLLDAEPRTASVSAVEPTRLFRLGHADFDALIVDRPHIIHAINRVLCQIVRRTMRRGL
jgi:hypothetical protein